MDLKEKLLAEEKKLNKKTLALLAVISKIPINEND
jgi:hypothetical protein